MPVPSKILLLSGCGVTQFGIEPIDPKQTPVVTRQEAGLESTLQSSDGTTAEQFNFNYDIDLFLVDSSTGRALVVGTDEQKRLMEKPIFMFEPSTGKIHWAVKSQAPNFRVRFIKQLPDKVILNGSNKVFALDKDTGDIEWQREGHIFPLCYDKRLAYSINRLGIETKLHAFDLETGKDKWVEEAFSCGWWGFNGRLVNENALLLSGDGLHLFDLSTGKGWHYELDTDAVGGTGKVILGAILSALTGVYVGSAGPDRYENLTSNALVLENTIYYASNRSLASVNAETGQENWKISLPKIAAHSLLREDGDRIMLVGLGWCHKNGLVADYSVPYIALFNKQDGRQLLYKPFGSESRVNSYHFTQNNCHFLSAGKLYYFDTKEPEKLIIEPMDDFQNEDNKLIAFIGKPENYYALDKEDGSDRFRCLTSYKNSEGDKWIKTTTGIVQIGKDLKVIRSFQNEAVFKKLDERSDVAIIRSFQRRPKPLLGWIKFVDMNDQGRLIGEIKTDLPAIILEDNLILRGKNNIIIQPFPKFYAAVQ